MVRLACLPSALNLLCDRWATLPLSVYPLYPPPLPSPSKVDLKIVREG